MNYVTVSFKNNNNSITTENSDNLETVYAEVKTEEPETHALPVPHSEKNPNPALCPRPAVVRVCLWGVGVLAAVVLIVFLALLNGEMERMTLEKLQLRGERDALLGRVRELKRERDRLNWTLDVILTYDNFPVSTVCPGKVCKACPDHWVQFQSQCYQFSEDIYSFYWRSWTRSREWCREMRADLVVVDSLEEQEFINNHTVSYDDENHGYWIGLRKTREERAWSTVEGTNANITFWIPDQTGYSVSCALSLPSADPTANWRKSSCEMKNRWICETRALTPAD